MKLNKHTTQSGESNEAAQLTGLFKSTQKVNKAADLYLYSSDTLKLFADGECRNLTCAHLFTDKVEQEVIVVSRGRDSSHTPAQVNVRSGRLFM